MPLPPLKPKNTVQLWPATAATAMMTKDKASLKSKSIGQKGDGNDPFDNIQDQHDRARPFAQNPKGIGGPHIPGAMLADINAFKHTAKNIRHRNGADQISKQRANCQKLEDSLRAFIPSFI